MERLVCVLIVFQGTAHLLRLRLALMLPHVMCVLPATRARQIMARADVMRVLKAHTARTRTPTVTRALTVLKVIRRMTLVRAHVRFVPPVTTQLQESVVV